MKHTTLYRLITLSAIVQIILSLLAVGLFFWVVDAQPESASLQSFRDGLRSAITAADAPLTYELAGALAAGPLIYLFLSIIAIIATKKQTRIWIQVGLGFGMLGAVIGIASGGIPLFQIVIASCFFALYRQKQKDEKDDTAAKEQ